MGAHSLSPGDPKLERDLRAAMRGDVRFDALTRGLYSTDASHYQVEPLGVVLPRSVDDVEAAFAVARHHGAPLLPRGGGTSQCGQSIGRALVLDTHRHLNGIGPVERERTAHGAAEIVVEPGVVLDHLNGALRPDGLWFPVDPSTGSRATLGGMAGNNSAGARSIRHGMMVDNVVDAEVVLADGRRFWLSEAATRSGTDASGPSVRPSTAGKPFAEERARLLSLRARHAAEIERRRPKTMRNVAGYNLDRMGPEPEALARLVVGSEGTLAFFSRLRLALAELPRRRALGVCHFPDLHTALDSVQHLVTLEPSAVELVDDNVLRLAAEQPDFRSAMAEFVRGAPGALLLVEFSSTDPAADFSGELDRLEELLGGLGIPEGLVRATTPEAQAAVWAVRKAGLNIVMSMAGARKPISFIEDCAVPLEHLAEYADEVDAIFRRHGTDGTWYAHASVGCLHVRPALNLRDPDDVALVRRIAEETHEVVRRFGGTHSGEHGDGILRSEFLEPMLGRRMVGAFREVKETFDPDGLMNPGRIVDPPRMDDRSLFRFHPGYGVDQARSLPVVLDWSATGGLLGATERCNNNGACRKSDPGVMCPSFRATQDEKHSTRGRANALRLALTGQLGADGLDRPEMVEAMSLCISCKGCRRECPTGVDMARMKIEWQHARNRRHGVPLRERLLAELPRMAPVASRFGPVANLLDRLPGRSLLGLAAERTLPRWAATPWRDGEAGAAAPRAVLFVDTFSRWFEPEIPRAAVALLEHLELPVVGLAAPPDEPPLCCGRTWLSQGMVDEARREAERLLAAALPLAEAGLPIIGLEPSCLYTLKDEIPALLPGPRARLLAERARLLEEFVDAAWDADGDDRPGGDDDPDAPAVLVHGHCHQKAFGGMDGTLSLLRRVTGSAVTPIESGCCGMAGSFGYHAEHHGTSMAIGELDLLPAVRAAPEGALLVAGGTSCRAQIRDGTGRTAVHPVVAMAGALELVY